MEMGNRNRDIRKRQSIPHMGGAMSLSRRRENLKLELGKNIGRAEMWKVTHKRKNGTYVNDEAMEIGSSTKWY
ncbi:putative transposase [Vigna unguiculata]|uniref:Putative transposase n=1 Tax=Vigna unguiculata TaxID=3917 RepID=A0A4D6L1R5_VIGUN|nr:putative transposase [Vigna unguiculata]